MSNKKNASDKYSPRIKGLVHLGNCGHWNPFGCAGYTKRRPDVPGITFCLPFLPDAKNIINPKLAKYTTKWSFWRLPRK